MPISRSTLMQVDALTCICCIDNVSEALWAVCPRDS